MALMGLLLQFPLVCSILLSVGWPLFIPGFPYFLVISVIYLFVY